MRDHLDLTLGAATRGITPVQPRTAAKYGLTVDEWLALLAAQGWCCAVCRRHRGVKLTTDHEHVPGWRGKPPEERKRYVRGVLCQFCNYRLIHSRLSAEESARITEYLVHYEQRRDA